MGNNLEYDKGITLRLKKFLNSNLENQNRLLGSFIKWIYSCWRPDIMRRCLAEVHLNTFDKVNQLTLQKTLLNLWHVVLRSVIFWGKSVGNSILFNWISIKYYFKFQLKKIPDRFKRQTVFLTNNLNWCKNHRNNRNLIPLVWNIFLKRMPISFIPKLEMWQNAKRNGHL